MFGFPKRQPPRERIEPHINMSDVGVWGDSVVSADSQQVIRLLGDPPTESGAVVNSATSMRVSAVFACVRLIAGAIASLPIDIYRRDAAWRPSLVMNDPLWWLLNEQACDQFTSATFKEFLVAQMLLRGDGLAYIVRNDPYGPPAGFLPLRREQVVIQRVPPEKPGRPPALRYFVNTPEGSFGVEQHDMLHLPGLGFNGVQSLSVIQWGARNAIGIAMRADEFAGRFFSNGAQPQHAIKAAGTMSPEKQEELRAAWAAKYQGTGPNGIPLILTEGLDVTELTMSAVDAQLLESRKWQVSDIARAFGVPEFMIGATEKTTSWGTGIEQMGQGFVDYTLAPHIQRLEDELNRKLFRRAPKYARVNVDAMMRGDAIARSTYYKAAIGGTQNPAWMTPNEVRVRENLPPIVGGDELTKPEPPGGDNNGTQPPDSQGA